MQKITPFLWLDGKAEEAAKFYTSIFKNSKIGKISRYGGEVIPTALGELMSDPDSEKSGRVMKAMLQMEKIDIRGLQQAHENKTAAPR